VPELSILIPCLNEADNLPLLIERLEKVTISTDLDVETIILDDASVDDTIEVARTLQATRGALNIRIIHRFEPRRGYGSLIRYGLACAAGRYCLLVAADGAHPIEMLPEYLAQARRGAQLVQCSRFERREDVMDIPPRFRRYQAAFRLLARLLLGWDMRDPTCSFKLVDRTYLLAIGIGQNGLAVVPEIAFKVRLSGGKIVFVPGSQSFRPRGISEFRLLREAMSYAYVLVRAWLHRFGLAWF
jgi:glycosyltransferase involved in cell wall biosynthesis